MTGLAISIENLIESSDNITYIGTALTVKRPTVALEHALTTMVGLEASTYLSGSISQESLFSWIKDKLSKLGRKFNVAFNKVYAVLAGADKKTKELIRKAERNRNIKLPISGAKAAGIIASGTVLVSIIAFLIHCARIGNIDEKKMEELRKRYDELHKQATYTPDGIIDIGENGEMDEKQFAGRTPEVIKEMNENHKKQDDYYRRKEKGYKGIVGDEAKRFLKALANLFGKIMGALKRFGAALKSGGGDSSQDKASVGNRLKNIGKCISNVFKSLWKWLSSGWKRVVNKK